MSQVYRCYVEKKPAFREEGERLLRELRGRLGIAGLEWVRVLNRYDTEGVTQVQYRAAVPTVFSEPQVDDFYEETLPQVPGPHSRLSVEPLPGQYDQRADSCAQCIRCSPAGSALWWPLPGSICWAAR